MRDISHISTYESGMTFAAAHRVLNRVNAGFLAAYDLTPLQWFVIGSASDNGPAGIQLSDLKEELGTSMPFVTTTVNQLESKGILQKISHTEDSRVKIAKLNPLYKKTVTEIEDGLRDELRENLYEKASVSREELSVYIQVMYKIAQTYKDD